MDRITRQRALVWPLAVLIILAFESAGRAAESSSCFADVRPRIVAHRGASSDRPENTLLAIRRAIDVGAHVVEIDVRTSKDGVLFLLHDSTLDRTTNGTGPATEHTIAELKSLDAGVFLDEAYRGTRIATLDEALALCRGKIDVLLDLKEQSEPYARAVARAVQAHGDPERVILGVHRIEEPARYRQLLPRTRQLGFIPDPTSIEAFTQAGVQIIRLWPKWLSGVQGNAIVQRVRKADAKLQLNGSRGTPQEILPLLRYRPDALLVDDPAQLKATLDVLTRSAPQLARLAERVDIEGETITVPWIAGPQAVTFLNRDYVMLELPEALHGQPRVLFAGGEGDRVALHFRAPAVVFAAFEYNTTGAWSFPEGHSPTTFGWHLVKKAGYRGSSNAVVAGKAHYARIYCRTFQRDERLQGLPPWWLCLAVVDEERAAKIPGFAAAMSEQLPSSPPFLYGQWASHLRPLQVAGFENARQWATWQQSMRERFRQRLVFPYDASARIATIGEPVERGPFEQQEFHVLSGGRRLFRFFRLAPRSAVPPEKEPRLATVVCFMGHGKVRQILEERDSYQHACAAQFAERGYLVFAMENVGMEPEHDSHHELDRLLRLDGYGWYSLLFAHQQMLLDHVFADRAVDTSKVAVTGVSTGGLLALSAAAMEPRVAAASVQGIFGSMRVSFIRDRSRHCACGAIPGLLPEFDLPELALLASPRPLHFSNATDDGFSPQEARRCVQQISPLYRKAGGPTPQLSVPPGRHEYALGPALQFFERTIGKPARPAGKHQEKAE